MSMPERVRRRGGAGVAGVRGRARVRLRTRDSGVRVERWLWRRGFGTPISEAEIAPWDISIMPDGSGLPPGSGTPEQGAKIFAAKCALCHGPEAKGGTNAALVGGAPLTNGIDTPKTIANFWPYATTLFDFTRRAMPWQQPRS